MSDRKLSPQDSEDRLDRVGSVALSCTRDSGALGQPAGPDTQCLVAGLILKNIKHGIHG